MFFATFFGNPGSLFVGAAIISILDYLLHGEILFDIYAATFVNIHIHFWHVGA